MKYCQICNKPSGFYPLCSYHLTLKKQGKVIKDEETGIWKEIQVEMKPFEIKDYYNNIKNKLLREDKENTELINKMIAMAKELFIKYNDSSLIDRFFDDINEIKSHSNNEINTLRTNDGHVVKSQGERIIDDILYANNIVHCYEKEVTEISSDCRTIKSDWYIPVLNGKGIYIEYWGINNDLKYLKNKEEKKKIYKEYNIPLIDVYKDDVLDVPGLSSRIAREIASAKRRIFDDEFKGVEFDAVK